MANIRHELRTPLRFSIGCAELGTLCACGHATLVAHSSTS